MSERDATRPAELEEQTEELKRAKRRDEALLRAPVTEPENFPKKEARRLYAEAQEEIQRRGR